MTVTSQLGYIPVLHLLCLNGAMFNPVPNTHCQDLPCGARTKSRALTGAQLWSYQERIYRRYKGVIWQYNLPFVLYKFDLPFRRTANKLLIVW